MVAQGFDSLGSSSSKTRTMTTSKLSETAIESLVGKTIIEANENWIKLSDGCIIYLDDAEVEMLNQ